ncbi:RnfABCDGE type electron transport complex subunit D, partial [Arthrospira platensis SPKY1]|nr:RnfABCDGE type electron transport complex subunit D [Arthrospira platensis SPKY1]
DIPDGRYLGVRGTNLAMPFFKGEPVDAVSTATPLSQLKFSQEVTSTTDLLLGNISGSLGETSGALLILLGVYLVWRKIINWRIPVSILLTAAVFSALLYLIDPTKFPSPQFTVLAGGMLLGAVYMATD